MNSKRAADSDAAPVRKKQRRGISIELKMDIVNRLERGERQSDICKALNLAGSTVRTIWKNAEHIKRFGEIAVPLGAVRLTRNRATIMVEMERQLMRWIEEHAKCFDLVPPSLVLIQEKARNLYDKLKDELPEGTDVEPFTASRGWFNRFRRRTNSSLFNNMGEGGVGEEVSSGPDVEIQCGKEEEEGGEQSHVIIKPEINPDQFDHVSMNTVYTPSFTGESCSENDQVTANYKNKIKAIIADGNYTPHQVFNVDETGLFWKRLPKRTQMAQDEEVIVNGYVSSKERVSLLLGGNAAGDFKLKPLVVYHTESPRALNGFPKQCLPVVWRSNKSAWITRQVFKSWYSSYLCKTLKEYCERKNLEHKVLLIMDNSPGHPTSVEDIDEHIKIAFLPSTITSLLQPMDQGVIKLFKSNYLKETFSRVHRALQVEEGLALKSVWDSYNIRHAVENVAMAWDGISSKAMNVAWKSLWSDCVKEEVCINEQIIAAHQKMVELCVKLGMKNVDLRDIYELVDSNREELTKEELSLLREFRKYE